MQFSIYGKSHEVLWTNVGLLAFAIIFFIVGASRIVEFEGLEFSKTLKRFFISVHLLGTLCFSLSIAFLGVSETDLYKPYSTGVFIVAIFILFPLHIFLAIKRRIRSHPKI